MECNYKNGDILIIDDKYPFIYDGTLEEPDFMGSYCGVNCFGRLVIDPSKYWGRIGDVRRATEKEKRDFARELLKKGDKGEGVVNRFLKEYK